MFAIRPTCRLLGVALAAVVGASGCGATSTPSGSGATGSPATPRAGAAATAAQAAQAAPARLAVVVGAPDHTSIVEMTVTDGWATGPSIVVAAGNSPAWAPGGRLIALTCPYKPDEFPGLCLLDLEALDAGPRLILPEVISVTWSPTGERLALGRSAIDFGDSFLALPDGTGLQALAMPEYEVRVDRWSPDGTALTGAASFQGMTAPVVAVCSAAQAVCRGLGPGRGLDWSPDGSRILAAASSGQGTTLTAIDASTGDRTLLAELGAAAAGAAWSSTGVIAVVLETGALMVLNAPGADARQIAPDLRFSGTPAWSPDGAWIAVREGTEMTGDIYLVSADGGDTVRLTEDGLGKSAVWAPAE